MSEAKDRPGFDLHIMGSRHRNTGVTQHPLGCGESIAGIDLASELQ